MPPFLSGLKKGPVLKTGPFEVFRTAMCKHIADILADFRMAYANSAKYLMVRTI